MLYIYPLQITASDFAIESTVSVTDIIIFLVLFVALIGVSLIIGKISSKNKIKSGGGVPLGFIARIKMHRLARSIGLHNFQIKMLDYVFKVDSVVDYEKSFHNAALLDRHFRRAYRIIDQTSGSESEAQRRLAVLFSTRNVLENSSFGGIGSTRQLKDDTTLTLTFGRDKFDVSVVSSRGDQLSVEAPTNILGSHIKIPVGTKLTILFFTKSNKGFSFETRVEGYGTHSTMHLAHSSQIRFLSQRRYRRRQAVIACFLNLVYVEGSGKKQRLIVDKRRISGTIADISVGGCSVKAMAPVQVGAKFKIEFTHRNVKLAALGQVLRTNRAGASTTIHVKFLKVSQKTMNIINAYVYEYANE